MQVYKFGDCNFHAHVKLVLIRHAYKKLVGLEEIIDY